MLCCGSSVATEAVAEQKLRLRISNAQVSTYVILKALSHSWAWEYLDVT